MRVGRVRWRRLAGLVDRDHSEDDLVLLLQSLGDLAPQRLLARGRLVHGDLLPRVRLERPLLDDVVGDLGAAVLPRRVPLQVDAVDVPVDVAYILWGIGEAYSIRSFRTLSVQGDPSD